VPHRKKSVATSVVTAIVAVTVVLLAGRVVHVYLSARGDIRREMAVELAADADRAAIALELAVWNIDRGQIDRVIESTLRTPDIYAVVVEAAGRTHAMTRDEGWRPVPFDGVVGGAGLLREDRDVVFGGDRIGHVAVFATPRFGEEKLRGVVVGTATAATLISVVAAGLLWLFLRSAMIAPLRALEGYAEAVSAGTRPDPTALGARFEGELERLRWSMQHMVALLDSRYAQLAEAEASVRALAARLERVREEEKTRIARDLHDDLGQLLTAVQMELRWVEERLAEHPEAALANALTDHVVEVTRLVDDGVRSVQRIAADLRPSALDRLGLGAALRAEGRRFHERSGVLCEVVVEGELPDLLPDAATALYRVAQEALTNVARHAHASRATVSLTARGGELSLRVEDDGRGLSEPGPGPHAIGLLGMKERAALLGGTVAFLPGKARGTVVELRVPLARVVASGERRAAP
jgi:signal transduction histidine kinase